MQCPACGVANAENATTCTRCAQPMILAAASSSLPPLEEVSPAKPSGQCPSATLLAMGGASVLTALIVGGLYHLITRFIDLLIVFPIGAGLIIGVLLSRVIQPGKCRSTKAALTCGLLAGLLAYGTQIVLGSRHARPEFVQAMTETVSRRSNLPERIIKPLVERNLNPVNTLKVYLLAQAAAGVNVGHPGSRASSGIPLKGTMFWLLLAVEALLMGGTAAAVARESARQPFCERCVRWRQKSVLFRTNPKQAEPLLEKVQAQDWEGADKLPTGGPVESKNLCEVFVHRCSNCGAATITATSTGKGKNPLFHARLPNQATERLVQLGKLPGLAPTGATGATGSVAQPTASSSSDPSPWSS